MQFHEARGRGAVEQARVEAKVRTRVLTWMVRQGLLEPELDQRVTW